MMLQAQTLNLDSCQAMAMANYPLARQYDLIERTASLNFAIADKAFLPQLAFSARASYQSAVTEIPTSLETMLSQLSGQTVHFNGLSRDQYQVALEMQQLIWDGGAVRASRRAIMAGSEAERRQLDAELYTLRDRINTLYFNILLLDEQKRLLERQKDVLEANKDKLKAYLASGIALPSDVDALEVERIGLDQQERVLHQHRSTYLQWLCVLTGVPYSESLALSVPTTPNVEDGSNHRPELALYSAREVQLEAQRKRLTASTRPQLGLFLQGGVGRPGLNLFSNTFEPFYIGGLQLRWQLGSWYTYKDQQRKLDLSQQRLEVQRATFLLNNRLEVISLQQELEELTATLQDDERLVVLRRNIQEASEARFANGIMTYSDLLKDLNATYQALQQQVLHRIQRQQVAYRLQHSIYLNQSASEP